MLIKKEKEILEKYFPVASVEKVYDIIKGYNIHFKITNKRSTKLGDYRPPGRKPYHRISVNNDLNQYAFLITFIHEVAHLIVYEKFKSNVSSPHGIEWKTEYRNLMNDFLRMNIFPDDLRIVISNSIINSKASSSSDLKLLRLLKKYDRKPNVEGVKDLEELTEGQVFVTENGGLFRKGEKQRVRYRCYNINNRKWYLFHPLTPVLPYKEV